MSRFNNGRRCLDYDLVVQIVTIVCMIVYYCDTSSSSSSNVFVVGFTAITQKQVRVGTKNLAFVPNTPSLVLNNNNKENGLVRRQKQHNRFTQLGSTINNNNYDNEAYYNMFPPKAVMDNNNNNNYNINNNNNNNNAKDVVTLTAEHIKKAGGGVATVPTGNSLLFDPSIEGKLGGTSSLYDRLSLGTAYVDSQSKSSTSISPISAEYIMNAGGGVPTIPSGDRTLFDPATLDGKITSTTSLDERLAYGAAFGTTTPTTPTVVGIISNEHVKKAGCGIAIIPTGDCLLFDPSFEGKLGGTSSLRDRLQLGTQYTSPVDPAVVAQTDNVPDTETTVADTTTTTTIDSTNILENLYDTQHWLEDIGYPPPVFAKPSEPVNATVLGRARLIPDDTPGDIEHVILQLPPGFHYIEGQSISVIPPGIDPTKTKVTNTIDGSTIVSTKPYKPRLYSIASTRYGDLLDGNTVSLCVRRAEYIDPESGQSDPTKAGICSNYLCSTQPGDQVQIAGPIGKSMLLPTGNSTNKDLILVATGTGIAPFRSYLHRLFVENTVARHTYTGTVWLIFGVSTTSGILYKEELDAMIQSEYDSGTNRLKIDYAISREMTSSIHGGKVYVQDVLAANADELFTKLDAGAILYCCGLKGMMPGIFESLQQVSNQRGIDWSMKLNELLSNKQFHVEVY